MPLTAGSAAKILLAYGPPGLSDRILPGADFDAAELGAVAKQGWAESIGERDPALASVSAPVRDSAGEIVAVLSISGPVERLSPSPFQAWGREVLAAAADMEKRL